ncbi:hypothetical protein [Paraburkholderia mimosarum]|uniref:hypothetical protein n=1 Tax=Paraburkholderia mimosarum TaxID=312026 RepID=UPI000408361B|nr:hypothetical protein [Paraburkholderia mimosarum]
MTKRYMRPEITPGLRDAMNRVGSALGQTFEGRGYALLVFDFGPGGTMNWISNADRHDVIATLREFIAVSEGNAHDAPDATQ